MIAALRVGAALFAGSLVLAVLTTAAILRVTLRALHGRHGGYWHDVAIVAVVTLIAAAGNMT